MTNHTKAVYMERFAHLREEALEKIRQAKENGVKVAGTYCTYAPQEIMMAAGIFTVSLCGTKQEPVTAAEKVLPPALCPLIKSSYGFAATDTCPFFYFADFLVAETTCDGKKKMYELLAQYKPLHLLQLPQEQASLEAKEFWLAEVGKLKLYLEEKFSVNITGQKLREAIVLLNRERTALKRVFDLNQQVPAPFSGMEMLTIAHNRGFYPDKEELIGLLEGIACAAASEPVREKEGPRLLLTGVPVGLGSEKVIRLAEELGAVVVCQENCTSYKPVDVLVDEEKDPLAAIADKYLSIGCSCMSPNPNRYELIGRLSREFHVDGVIDLAWTGCHTYAVEAYSMKEFVTKSCGVPYLALETDYSATDTEQLRIRLEAFLEIIDR